MASVGVRVERLYCPIGTCPWTHDRTPPTGNAHTLLGGQSPFHEGPPANLQEAIADAAYATLLADGMAVESVVRAHLETHPLLDWVTEVMRLRGLPDEDWTVDPGTGRSNSSRLYQESVAEVDRLIRQGGGHCLDAHWSHSTASLIVAQLAHVHRWRPTAEEVSSG